MTKPNRDSTLQSLCHGQQPLTARLEQWMLRVLNEPDLLTHAIEELGSPLNLIHPELLKRNIQRLEAIAGSRHLDFRVYFARKANKCLAFVDAANDVGSGIDVASLAELQQCLARGVAADQLILTAAIKNRRLVEEAISHGVCIAVDNSSEVELIQDVCQLLQREARVAMRLSGFEFRGQPLISRFGVDVSDALPFA
ncbi:MAG: alanine racemase, partial [Lacipirellulaceae bacterium]